MIFYYKNLKKRILIHDSKNGINFDSHYRSKEIFFNILICTQFVDLPETVSRPTVHMFEYVRFKQHRGSLLLEYFLIILE